MTTWFTSDTHFGHAKIIDYCKRPFKDVEEMNETLINNWNAVVRPGDTVWHLGDFAFGTGMTAEFASIIYCRLKGAKHFITGNHDDLLRKVLLRQNQEHSCHQYKEIEVNGQKIVLFHYGLRTWHHDLRGTWHLYGHSHNGLPALGKSCDVGVDNPEWNFMPISFEDLRSWMGGRDIHKAPEFANFEGSGDEDGSRGFVPEAGRNAG